MVGGETDDWRRFTDCVLHWLGAYGGARGEPRAASVDPAPPAPV